MTNNMKFQGWTVTLAGTAINLALGVLYTWSIIKGGLPGDWTATQKNLPYAIACLMFALMMVPAGRLQDKIGPRWVATMGGLLVGLGLVIASRSTSVLGFVIGFGVLAGSGIGLGYASATPAAVKWFPPQKTGMIAGIVVAGFGLASVYISPLVKVLLAHYLPADPAIAAANPYAAVGKTMFILGIAFLAAIVLLSQLLRNPPAGYKPATAAPSAGKSGAPAVAAKVDFTATQMFRTPQFYLLWIMFSFAAGAGLMIISTMGQLTKAGAEKYGFILVALLAIGNAGGRVAAGIVSDKIGRVRAMLIVFLFQALLMFALIPYKTYPLAGLIVLAMLIGANYGANLSLFPSIAKDWFGTKNFGFNYGLIFTSWGVGGFLLSFLLAGKFKDWTGDYTLAFIIAGVLLIIAAGLTFIIKPPTALSPASKA